MAIGEEIYLSFNQKHLDNCKRIGELFYCENMLLLKHISQYPCASAIYMNKMELVKLVCSEKYLEGYRPKPQIIKTLNYILLIGMPTPWNLYCNQALDIPISIKENSLAMIRWKDLCYCGFRAGKFYINKNIISCEDEKRRLSSKISTYYTINAISADYFHETMSEINKTGNKLMLEMRKQINIIDMTYANLNKRKQKYVELSSNIVTDEQIDLTSPEWKFLDNKTDYLNLQKDQAVMTKDLGQMVKKAKEGNLEIKKPYAKQQAFDKAMKGINKWIYVQKDWTFILSGLAVVGIIAFVCNLFLCTYVKQVRNNQTNMEMHAR